MRTWRRADEWVEGAGWATFTLMACTSWLLAWYIVWLLPFVAFVRSRRFRVAAVAMCAWISVQWLPLLPVAMHHLGVNPSRTATWHQNSLYEKRLVR